MPISAVDLFCGIGGLTHGLQLAGIPVAVGIDVENSCRFAYEQNNDARFVLRDITQVTGDELRNYFIPNTIKVLVGCAPCQPFSTYSLRYNKKDGKTINGGCFIICKLGRRCSSGNSLYGKCATA